MELYFSPCFNGAYLEEMMELASVHVSMDPSLEKWWTFASLYVSIEHALGLLLELVT